MLLNLIFANFNKLISHLKYIMVIDKLIKQNMKITSPYDK